MSTSKQPLTRHAQAPPRSYTVGEVAQSLNLLPSTVSRWVREGKIPATRIDRRYYIMEDDLAAFMGGHLVTNQQHRRITITHEAAQIIERLAEVADLPPFVVVECLIRESAHRYANMDRAQAYARLARYLQPEP